MDIGSKCVCGREIRFSREIEAGECEVCTSDRLFKQEMKNMTAKNSKKNAQPKNTEVETEIKKVEAEIMNNVAPITGETKTQAPKKEKAPKVQKKGLHLSISRDGYYDDIPTAHQVIVCTENALPGLIDKGLTSGRLVLTAESIGGYRMIPSLLASIRGKDILVVGGGGVIPFLKDIADGVGPESRWQRMTSLGVEYIPKPKKDKKAKKEPVTE